ncbi:MAG: hypothetical protein JXK94_00130 [Deltaproteobacteria bacterium]|nr:hypothetical protein [Deltaproteobacteria bacterium]
MTQQTDKIIINKALADIEAKLRELEILYEKYFLKIEKREPLREREDLARRLRQFVNRRILQTDLNFRYQTLSGRFYSYAQYWDRIVRMIDEGKYTRGQPGGVPTGGKPSAPAPSADDVQVDTLYKDYLRVSEACQSGGKVPDRAQIAAFLTHQKEKVAQKLGSSNVNLSVEVVAEDGKPKIKVRVKKG